MKLILFLAGRLTSKTVSFGAQNNRTHTLDYYLWGAVKDKCYGDKLERIDALKDNMCEAIGEIQLHTIDVIKNWTDRVGQPRQPFE